jgi:hypothetical protein
MQRAKIGRRAYHELDWINCFEVNLLGGDTVFTPIAKTDKEAEDLFDSSVKEVEEATKIEGRVRNVFISFHVDDEREVNLLRGQAKNENFDLEFRDYSVKEPFDEKWKTQCRERIGQTSALIVMIGENTATREAVNWEIEEAYKQGKKVVGIRIHSDKNHTAPAALVTHGAKIINWNRDEIRKFLDEP